MLIPTDPGSYASRIKAGGRQTWVWWGRSLACTGIRCRMIRWCRTFQSCWTSFSVVSTTPRRLFYTHTFRTHAAWCF